MGAFIHAIGAESQDAETRQYHEQEAERAFAWMRENGFAAAVEGVSYDVLQEALAAYATARAAQASEQPPLGTMESAG